MIAGKRKGVMPQREPQRTPSSHLETDFSGINSNSSSMTNHNTFSLNDWFVDTGCTSHMTYDEYIFRLSGEIFIYTTHKFQLEML